MTSDEQASTAGLRRLFLDAARAILAEPDSSLELRKVAERAGKSRTAPYLAFGKSDEGGGLPALQLGVAAEGFRELVSGMEGAVRGARDAREALEAMATAYLAFADQQPRLFRLMFGSEVRAALDADPLGDAAAREQAEFRQARRALEQVIQETIEAQAPGYLASTLFADSATVTGAIWALLHGVAVLTIDQQWGLGELRGAGAPDDLAWRVLGFLTSESARSLEEAGRLLVRAKADKGMGGEMGGEMGSGEDASLDGEPDALSFAVSDPRFVWERTSAASRDTPHALHRAKVLGKRLRGLRLLWIDDDPSANRIEIRMFQRLGIRMELATSTEAALAKLERGRFDLVLSDIAREGRSDEGVRALPMIRKLAGRAPVIFYVGNLLVDAPAPEGALGITNDPEELLELVLDGVEG